MDKPSRNTAGELMAPVSFADLLSEGQDLMARHFARNPGRKMSGLKTWLSAIGVKHFISYLLEHSLIKHTSNGDLIHTLMLRLNIVYSLSFFKVKPAIPTKPKPKRNMKIKAGMSPMFRAIQLTPTKGSRLHRTNARTQPWFAIKIGADGEEV